MTSIRDAIGNCRGGESVVTKEDLEEGGGEDDEGPAEEASQNGAA